MEETETETEAERERAVDGREEEEKGLGWDQRT